MSEPLTNFVLRLHAFSTVFMVGLIWFVQIVHYPMFANVGASAFAQYEQIHQRLTTWIVGPPMLIELATAIVLIRFRPPGISPALLWTGAGLLVVIWLSTACLQVPAHNQLMTGFAQEPYQRLVQTNWIRTIAWTARGILALMMLERIANRITN